MPKPLVVLHNPDVTGDPVSVPESTARVLRKSGWEPIPEATPETSEPERQPRVRKPAPQVEPDRKVEE